MKCVSDRVSTYWGVHKKSNLFHVIAHVISEKSARGPVIRSISRQPMLTLGFTEKVASLLPVCVRFWGDRLVE